MDQLSTLRAELASAYLELLKAASDSLKAELIDRSGSPFFTCPRQEWLTTKRRILVVGKAPHKWGFPTDKDKDWRRAGLELWWLRQAIEVPDSVEILMDRYVKHTYEFAWEQNPTDINRAFLAFQPRPQQSLEGEVISANLYKCAIFTGGKDPRPPSDCCNAAELEEIQDWQRGVLAKEIATLKPTHLIFFTAPGSDWALRRELPGLEVLPVGPSKPDLARLQGNDLLPAYAVRTFHPLGLRRHNLWERISEIAAEIYAP